MDDVKYGLKCRLLWGYFMIEVELPALWESIESAKKANLSFSLSEEGLICQESNRVVSIILSGEWWKYRIAQRKDEQMDSSSVDICHYIPIDCSLANFLPYRDNRLNLPLYPYDLEYLSCQIYIA